MISLVSLVVVGGVAFFVFHNYREERQVKQFFDLLQAAQDYKAAYALLGCTAEDRAGTTRSKVHGRSGARRAPHADVAITRSPRAGRAAPAYF